MVALALADLYQPKWSEEILAEAERNLARYIEPVTAKERIGELRELLPEALVGNYREYLVGRTNDPKDRHGVAAALSCKASIIVTSNVKDFRPIPRGLKTVQPDTFLYAFVDKMDVVLDCLESVRAKWPTPPPLEVLLRKLDRFAPQFANEVRSSLPGESGR